MEFTKAIFYKILLVCFMIFQNDVEIFKRLIVHILKINKYIL